MLRERRQALANETAAGTLVRAEGPSLVDNWPMRVVALGLALSSRAESAESPKPVVSQQTPCFRNIAMFWLQAGPMVAGSMLRMLSMPAWSCSYGSQSWSLRSSGRSSRHFA